MSAAVTFARQRPIYLWVLFAIPAIGPFAHTVTNGAVLVKGQGAGVVAPIVAAGVAAALWLPYRRRPRWPALVLVFLATVVAAWLYQVVRTQLDQSLFNLSVFVVPLAMLLIAAKPVRRSDAGIAMLVLAYSLLAISLASLVFGRGGWMPDGFEVSDGGGESRVALLEWVGIPGRWGGPFGSVNYASPIGGLLLVFGATRHGWHRWILVFGGILILALGQGRTALFAVAAGLVVLLAWSPVVAATRHPVRLRWALASIVAAGAVAYVTLVDPTFNGRTPIWSNFLGLLPQDPIFGVGESGILEFVTRMSAEPGFIPHTHAHSVLLDALVRYGMIMALVSLAIFGLALTAGVRALRRGDVSQLAVTVFVLAAGLTETIHSWFYLSAYVAALTWVVIAAGAPEEHEYAPADGPHDARSLAWHDA